MSGRPDAADHLGLVYLVMLRYFGTRDSETETALVSEGNLALVKCAASYDQGSLTPFVSYAYRRIHGAMQDWFRVQSGSRRKHPLEVVAWPVDLDGYLVEFADPRPSPLDDADLALRREWLEEGIARLTPAQRTVIHGWLEERSNLSLAEELGCTGSNITHLRNKGIKALNRMKENDHENSCTALPIDEPGGL